MGDRTELWWYVNGVEIVHGVYDPHQVEGLSFEIWDRLKAGHRWFCMTRDVDTGRVDLDGNDPRVGREVCDREGIRWPGADVAWQLTHGAGSTQVPEGPG